MIIDFINISKLSEYNNLWVYPDGSLSDMIMVNSVISIFKNRYPDFVINLVMRTDAMIIFEKNTSFNNIGYPNRDDYILKTNYWDRDFFTDDITPYECIGRLFGLYDLAENKITLNNKIEDNLLIINKIPWKGKNILIAPYTNNIRNYLHPLNWHLLIDGIKNNNSLILQYGDNNSLHIKGTYSLIGEYSFEKILSIVKKVDLIITHDNFFIQLAKYFDKQCVILLGPQKKRVHIFKGQKIFEPSFDINKIECSACIRQNDIQETMTDCPLGQENKCINKLEILNIINFIKSLI